MSLDELDPVKPGRNLANERRMGTLAAMVEVKKFDFDGRLGRETMMETGDDDESSDDDLALSWTASDGHFYVQTIKEQLAN